MQLAYHILGSNFPNIKNEGGYGDVNLYVFLSQIASITVELPYGLDFTAGCGGRIREITLRNGKLHKVKKDRSTEFWWGNFLHQIDGPAIDGTTKKWYVKGNLHRWDGPAVIHSTGVQEWWLNGRQILTVHDLCDNFGEVIGKKEATMLKLKHHSTTLVSQVKI
jgi:hypothetical protein